MAELELLLLGKPELRRNGIVLSLGRKKALALLAYLAVEGPRASRESLATLLWPELPRENSLASLRGVLVSLNQVFQDRFLKITRQEVALNPDPDFLIDVPLFLDFIRPCQSFQDEASLRSRLHRLRRAVELYRGEFLSGFTVSESRSFEEWQLTQTESLRLALSRTLQELVQGLTSLGEYEAALEQTQKWLAQDLYAEEAHRAMMRLYALSGRRVEAFRQYERCCRLLREEIDVAPETETTELWKAIKSQDPKAIGPEEAQVSSASLSRAAPVPPPPPDISHNLPFSPTVFVGRREELTKLFRFLTMPQVRLISVTGPGGIGKTRLAIEVLRQSLDIFPDGVIYVPLAPIRSSELLYSTIAERLYMSLESQSDPQRQVLTFLQDRKAILLLDNFEHLIDGAWLVADLLGRTSQLKILVTSRERLNLQGEWLLQIGGLEVPDSDTTSREEAENYSALRLFIEAAARIQPSLDPAAHDWPIISQICRRLGGLPLAIELAAGWLRMLTFQEVYRELERGVDFLSSEQPDLPERHRSLKSLFDYSISLLEPQEKEVFKCLVVFHGGFDREAAGSIASATLFQLRRLLDKSLLTRTTSGRFEIHELLRQYLKGLLQEDGERAEELSRLHSRYFLSLLKKLGSTLFGFEDNEVVSRLRSESENIRTAWRWADSHQDVEAIGKCINGLYRFYLLLSSSKEGEEVMSRAARLFEMTAQAGWKAAAEARQGHFALLLGDLEKSRLLLEQSLALSQKLNHLEEVAFVLTHLTAICLNKGEYELARRYLTDSRSIYRALNNRHGTAYTLLKQGRLEGTLGNLKKAQLHFNTAMGILEELGDLSGIGRCTVNLGTLAFLGRDYLTAIRLYNQGLEIVERLNDRKRMAICLSNLGTVYAEIGQDREAQDYGRRALRLMEEIGDLDSLVQILETMGRITRRLGELKEARLYYLRALKIASEIQAVVPALNTLQGIARLLDDEGAFELAYLVLSHVYDHPRVDKEARIQAEEALARVRAKIPAAKAEQIRENGVRMDLAAVSAEILNYFRAGLDSSETIR